ncbi:MAG: HAMP domain-containing sensor histidine kinase [Eubacteriales bacterium]|jgi:signal transduction histidine kinase|nr:HAMP domain-containing sensor histidine kinase [Eubacteriales bacterium]
MPKRNYIIAVGLLWLCMILCMVCFVFVLKQLYIKQTVSFLGIVSEPDIKAEQNIIDSFLNININGDYYEKGMDLLQNTGYEKSGEVIIGSFPGFYIMTFCVIISILFIIFIFISLTAIKRTEHFMHKTAVWVDDLQNNTEKSRNFYSDSAACPLINAIKEYSEKTAFHISVLFKEKENMNDFMEDIAHQLKTPLSVLRLIIEKHDINQESGIEQINKMTKLIGDLMTTGRFDSGKIKMNITSNNMTEFTEIVINDLYPLPENKNIHIDADGDAGEDWWFDTFWLKEAVLNILKNAVEHSPEDACINLYYKREAHEYIIRITGKGDGIESQNVNMIFNRFASINKNGTGLGLYIAKQILKSHFGDIYAANNLNEDVVFTLRFPVLKGSSFYN